nr:MAG TPA: hypothetical protein [Caudoviricetes sp.]
MVRPDWCGQVPFACKGNFVVLAGRIPANKA